jgi:hypothetical protein
MRFLCDMMLLRLGRWLRAAGYDTEFARHDHDDRTIVWRAAAEDRLLLSCDRKLAEAKSAARRLVLLAGNDLDGAALRLAREHGVDWLHQPFSRCLEDNAELGPAGPEQAAAVPRRARALAGPVTVCPACGRVYWPGSHYRRMLRRLEAWRAAAR